MVDMTIEDAQKVVDLRNKMTELMSNRNFKKIFVEGYFKNEAARLATAITNPEMMDDIDQREILSQIRSIGNVQNYILTIKQAGDRMEASIAQHAKDEQERERRANMKFEIDPITGDEIEVKDV